MGGGASRKEEYRRGTFFEGKDTKCVLSYVELGGHLWHIADRWKCGSEVQKRVCLGQ